MIAGFIHPYFCSTTFHQKPPIHLLLPTRSVVTADQLRLCCPLRSIQDSADLAVLLSWAWLQRVSDKFGAPPQGRVYVTPGDRCSVGMAWGLVPECVVFATQYNTLLHGCRSTERYHTISSLSSRVAEPRQPVSGALSYCARSLRALQLCAVSSLRQRCAQRKPAQ